MMKLIKRQIRVRDEWLGAGPFWNYTPGLPAPGRWSQEDWKLMASLSYLRKVQASLGYSVSYL